MNKNDWSQPGIPSSNEGVVLLALAALVAGVVLILSGKASVSEASVYTTPVWALVGVEKGRRVAGSG
ncbi:hypothetical protein [Streptomyces sp. NEAU-174]|uniref:hypothetical protein n=1 Tax=Streptomyces sp. NEAU-174 TaxID=3458254 RepID=UPI004044FA30